MKAGGRRAGGGGAGGVGAGGVGAGGVGDVAVGAVGGGVDVVRQVRSICDRSKWLRPKVQFDEECSNDKPFHRIRLRLGDVLSPIMRSQTEGVITKLHKLYDLLHEGLIINFNPDCQHPLLQVYPRHRLSRPGGRSATRKNMRNSWGK